MNNPPRNIPPPSVRHWLRQGWRYFVMTRWISMLFSSMFVIIGGAAWWFMADRGLGLIIYPLLTGFVVIAPILVTGFQRAARLMSENRPVGLSDLVLGISEGTPGIWFLSFILGVCYVIWVTDALVIYGMFFGIKSTPITMELLTDPVLKEQLLSYILFSGAMGFAIALMGFAVSAFSIPLILHRKHSFVSAVYISVMTVLNNKWLMLRWALTLAILVITTLLLALPLLVVVLPVTAYASYAAYVDLLGQT